MNFEHVTWKICAIVLCLCALIFLILTIRTLSIARSRKQEEEMLKKAQRRNGKRKVNITVQCNSSDECV
jgi:uncharacterized protein YpmS